jgi:uncharacterized protein (TIGR04255 family)
MNLPVQISPNPIITSSVEIRFEQSKGSAELLPIMFSKFSQLLPTIKLNEIPKEIRSQDPALRFSPDYILSNNNFSLAFSEKSIIFENVGEYKLWHNYFNFISAQLIQIMDLGLFSEVNRIGLRYTSLLENVYSIKNSLNIPSTIGISGYEDEFASFSTQAIKQDCNLLLQVFNNAKVTKQNVVKSGMIVDIDASMMRILPLNESILDTIDLLHTLEKELFYALINERVLKLLNPTY